MKKIFLAMLAFVGMVTISNAQTDKAKEKEKAAKAATVKKTAPAAATKMTPPAPAKAAASGQKLKADGTPDMRYKENKGKAAPVVHTKKDGTPDMRYKENKDKKKG